MGLVYHFDCSNEECDYSKDIYIGTGSFASLPDGVMPVDSVEEYKEYQMQHKRCPICESILIEDSSKGGSW